MTWRAFIIGLLAVILISALAPYNDWDLGNTYITGCHFPPGSFFLLLFLTLGVNVVLKLVRRRWALRQAELMLVWCMLIVGGTVVSSGLMRFLFSLPAAAPYYVGTPAFTHQERVLKEVPEALVLSKSPRSVAARDYFQGVDDPEGLNLTRYMRPWLRPAAAWLAFVALFYLAIWFIGGLLRKQWVESERLNFPLARVPLELTEGSGEQELLPRLVRNRAFQIGAVLTIAFAVARAAPAFIGDGEGWLPSLPIDSILAGTPLGNMAFWGAPLFPMAVGIAFLVPADVAASVWLFFLFTRCQLQVSHWIGRPITGATYSDFMTWQQAGAFIVFALMMFWAARRHLAAVLRKALPLRGTADDSAEPIPYRLGFWGAMAACLGMAGWFVFFEVHPLTAVALVALVMTVALVHARLIAQGGIFFTQHNWSPPSFLHSVTGGHAFAGAAAAPVVAEMQNAILIQDSREILSGHAMNALRISSLFEKHRRLFLPIMLVTLLVAVVVCSYFTLDMYYSVGGANTAEGYGTKALPQAIYNRAGRMITEPAASAEPHWWPLGLGAAIMFAVTMMRALFYWWPVHSLGFLIGSTWPAHNLWLSFFIAWGLKMFIRKFGGGGMLRTARDFFLGVIIGEAFAVGVSTLIGLVTETRLGSIFMPI